MVPVIFLVSNMPLNGMVFLTNISYKSKPHKSIKFWFKQSKEFLGNFWVLVWLKFHFEISYLNHRFQLKIAWRIFKFLDKFWLLNTMKQGISSLICWWCSQDILSRISRAQLLVNHSEILQTNDFFIFDKVPKQSGRIFAVL